MKKYFFFVLFLLLVPFAASAHNPRLVTDKPADVSDPIVIERPDISQAFYGRLDGEAEYYRFHLDSDQPFFLQVLAPAVPDARKDIAAELVSRDGERLAYLDPAQADWSKYYEEFGGDYYYSGASSTVELSAGDYVIRVSDANMTGKYVLVVGQKESFPPKEILNTIVLLPQLKPFFGSSPLTAYFNYSGIFLLFCLVALALLILVMRRIRKRYIKK